MKQLSDVLSQLEAKGVEVFLDEGKLKARARKGGLDAVAVGLIKEHKEALIDYLMRNAASAGDSRMTIVPGQRPASHIPLSFAQQRLWVLDRLDGGSAHYNMPAALRVSGRLDLDVAERAFQHIIQRHEALRTVFASAGEQSWQVIRDRVEFSITVHDLSAYDAAEREQRAQALARADALSTFDLASDVMLRASYLRLDEQEGIMLFNVHHIASDGWSMEVLVKEFIACYEALRNGAQPDLEELPVQYADYAVWQRKCLSGQVLEREYGYWNRQLAGLPPVHAIPLDHPRPPHQGFQGARHRFHIDGGTHQALKRLGQERQLTVFMILHGAISILLARHGSSKDIVIGTPVQNRLQKELEGLIGFFVNTLVLRADCAGNPSVGELLERIKTVNLEAQGHQDVPFEYLVERLKPERSRQYTPLFQILFSMSSHGEAGSSEVSLGDVRFSELASKDVGAKVELLFDACETADGIDFHIDYNVDLFEPGTIARMAQHLVNLLRAMAADPLCSILDLPMLGADELHYLQHTLNDTAAPFPQLATMHALFERQAAAAPERIALVGAATTLSYGELNSRANQLAHFLRAQAIATDTLVGVCMERGPDMIVALLAILKAGAAYVPFDPSYPPQRLAYMAEDSGVAWMLTQETLRERIAQWGLGAAGPHALCLDSADLAEALARHPEHNPAPGSEAADRSLAYVIYTSGSTGKPKGVLIEHRGAVNLATHQQRVFAVDADSRVLCFASLSFDAATFEWLMALTHGAALYVCSDRERHQPALLGAYLQEHRITHATLPPAVLPQIDPTLPLSLQCLVLAGEACTEPMVRPWLGKCRVFNAYGPTEATIWASVAQLHPVQPISIGRPIANTQLHVLDERGGAVPRGVAGELYIGGVGLARGYLNRPELTAERFVTNPLHVPGEADGSPRWYRTGDLVRHLPDGQLEFIGRIDDQVKLRGFRIELGEIEEQLLRDPAVQAAVVTVSGDSLETRRLVAYVATGAQDRAGTVERLRADLAASLPEYMVPAVFVPLDALPLTPNGKIDKKALPSPDEENLLQAEHVAARTATEHALVEICARLLRLPAEKISIEANFFALGGHSLLVMQMLAALEEAGLRADAQMIFGSPTLAAMAASMDDLATPRAQRFVAPANKIAPGCTHITPDMLTLVSLTEAHIATVVQSVPGGAANVQDIYPLAPLQEGMYFHHLLHRENDPYVMPALLAVDGQARLDAVLDALQCVIDRHDPLRTAILSEGLPFPVQVVVRRAELPLHKIELDPARDAQQQLLASFDQPQTLDLARAPMLTVTVAQDARQERLYLLIRLHHIISDHVGLEIIRDEIAACLGGTAGQLGQPMPYREFVAHALHQLSQGDAQAYFTDMLADVSEPTAPYGLLDVQGDGSLVAEASRRLEPLLAQAIRRTARERKLSPATLFHAAWALVVAACSGRTDVVFGTVLSGRLQGTSGAEHMLGMFINTLPMRVRLAGVDIDQLVSQVEQALRELLPYEQAPLALAQKCSGLEGNQPLFSALFNYRHTSDTGDQLVAAGQDGQGAVLVIEAKERTNYPFIGLVDDLGQDFTVSVQAHQSVDADRIVGYVEQALAGIVDALTRQQSMPALACPILPIAEQRMLLEQGAPKRGAAGQAACLDALFAQQVMRAPERVAVTCEGAQITYAQLDASANRLAHYLRERGVGPDTLVGLYMPRSVEMIVGLLAILKAGGAYVPLDPAHPQQRLAFMVADSDTALLLTHSALAVQAEQLCAGQERTIVCLDDTGLAVELGRFDAATAPCAAGRSPSDLAYIIYTSGSTGQPKGVMVEHANVTRLFAASTDHFEFGADDVWTMFHSFGFDFSVWEIWGALLYGARLVVVPHWVTLSADDFYELLQRERVTVLNQTPRAFGMLIAVDAEKRAQLALRYVIFGGEALNLAMLRPWVRAHGDAAPELINMYGITETTVHVTYRRLFAADIEQANPPSTIGRALPHLSTLVLTSAGTLAPTGVVGELYVGGAGLARGYLNRAQLTGERFIPNPYHDADTVGASPTLYRTGDLVRYRADGSMEYIGRADEQVKIRGFRIELGEIENQLLQDARVKSAAVLAREDGAGERRLVAYVTPSGPGDDKLLDAVKARLESVLPSYMVPAQFVLMDALPLTSNGKIDRKALPMPQGAVADAGMVAPCTSTEQALAAIWAELLNLPVEGVSATANFFALGGHSLLVMKMLSALRESGYAADVKMVYSAPDLAALAAGLDAAALALPGGATPPNRIAAGCQKITPDLLPLIDLSQDEIDLIVATVPSGAANVQDIYPLAPLQEGIYFFHLMHKENDPYVLPALLVLDDRARFEQLVASLQFVIDRHDAMRTAVLSHNLSMPVQVVYRKAELGPVMIELDPGRDALEQMRARFEHPQYMDLTQAPMLQICAAPDPHSDKVYALVRVHHLVEDITSSIILEQEARAYLDGRTNELAAPVPYREFVAHALRLASDGAAEAYFTERLGDVVTPTAPFNLLDVHGDGTEVEEARAVLDPALAERIRQVARTGQCSPAALFHAAWALVVGACSGSEDVVFGTVLSGRLQGIAGIQNMLGMFINTLPLRVQLSGLSVTELLQKTETGLRELLPHEQTPLALAQRCSGVDAKTPLFSAMLNYRHAHADQDDVLEASDGIATIEAQERTNYPFIGAVEDLGQGFSLGVQVHRKADAGRVLGYFTQSLSALVAALECEPQLAALSISVLPPHEHQAVLHDFNATDAEYPRALGVHELIEAQADATPARIALVFEERQLSYAELNERANQLAHYLREQGVTAGSLVGLYLERGPHMVIGALAICKAGGAYVPLDPGYPQERLRYMVQDSGAQLVLTDAAQLAQAAELGSGLRLACLDGLRSTLASYPRTSLPSVGAQTAYVIYTSGSTGLPKGVVVRHQGLCNFLHAMREMPGLQADDVLLAVTSLSFDIAALELYLPLTVGARVVLASQGAAREPRQLGQLIERHGVSVMQATPSTWRMLLESGWPQQGESLKVLCGGEALPQDLAQALLQKVPAVWNMYGPTETTIWSTVHCLTRAAARPLLGRPIANTRVYVLNDRLQPVPLGVAGHLYIGGDGLAQGYLNRPELTAERFIANPFGPGRLYQTGDLVRQLADGTLDYLGRSDDQVKIRGHRIELGEIESRLADHAAVSAAVVVARADGAGVARLVAYVTAQLEAQAGGALAQSLKADLAASLPEYMVPAQIMVLPEMPLTANGKIDRKALPAPDALLLQAGYVAPQTAAEAALVSIWADLLQLPAAQISTGADFFALGGHSLLAIRLVAEVRRRLDLEISIKDVFGHSVLADLAALLEHRTGAARPAVTALARGVERLPLSFAQQRLWVLEQVDGGNAHYNMAAALRVRGKFNVGLAEQAFRQIIARHEPLRTVIASDDAGAWQVVRADVEFSIARHDLSAFPIDQRSAMAAGLAAADAARNFDLAKDLMMRVSHLHMGEDDGVLLLNVNHIASDGWSMRLLTEQFVQVYAALSGDPSYRLAPLEIQYADYAHWQRNWLVGEVLESQLAYWDRQLADLPPVHGLPLDRPRGAQPGFRGARQQFELDAATLSGLKRLAREHQATLFMVLHAAISVLLARHGASPDIVIGTPVANRHQKELEEIVGIFVNTLVLRADCTEDLPFTEMLARIRAINLDAQSNQDVPFEYLVERLRPARSTQYSPLFQIMFSMDVPAAGAVQVLPGGDFEPLAAEAVQAKYELSFNAHEDDGVLQLAIEYNVDLFEADSIARMAGHCASLLRSIVADPAQSIYALPMLSAAERRHLVETMNATQVEFPLHRCIHTLFEEQVTRTPNGIALVCDDARMSYAELNERANQVADVLIRERQVTPDSLVGICVHRSLDMIVGILGILKSGAGYVPLDPEYPADRLAYMIADAGLRTVLTETGLLEQTGITSDQALCLDDPAFQRLLDASVRSNPDPRQLGLRSDHLAYVIYTSGSTGHPKGVMVEHRSLVNLACSTQTRCGLHVEDGLLQFSTINFDPSVVDIFSALCSGSRLILRTEHWMASVAHFWQTCEQYNVTVLSLPTAYWHELAKDPHSAPPPCIRRINIGGEQVNLGMVAEWYRKDHAANITLLNNYGPTEATVDTAVAALTDGVDHIGKAIENVSLFVLNRPGVLAPYGAPGQLYIGGASLARGYLNLPQLTAERYVDNPFHQPGNPASSTRLYATGDMARYLPDGNLKYLGRIDDQVKIRGFRIELGEIENRLAEHPEVGGAVVIAREDGAGDKRLVAYVTPKSKEAVDERGLVSALKTYLEGVLPEYMVPALFMVLESLPMTPNEKVDKRALPLPDARLLQGEYVAPGTPTEQALVEIWSGLLQLAPEEIGVTSNFFALGGHSLLLVRLISQVANRFEVKLDIRKLFELSDIVQIANFIDGAIELREMRRLEALSNNSYTELEI